MTGELNPLEDLVCKSQMVLTVMRTVLASTDIKPKKLRVTLIDDSGEHQDITLHDLLNGYDNTLATYKELIHGITQ